MVAPMLDHISLRVQDYPRAIAFYKAALAPIGYDVVMEFPNVAGLGEPGKPDLWISQSDGPTNPTHLALRSERWRVDMFYAAALGAGGSDNGPPGVRAHYHPNYYAAFVRDPEGNNIEVVCHEDPNAPKVSAAAASKPKAKAKARKKAAAKPKAKAKSKGKPAKKRRR
jgi:catechol 2,3-dioxygenase-like lactoylglutathione lyase family enzyme